MTNKFGVSPHELAFIERHNKLHDTLEPKIPEFLRAVRLLSRTLDMCDELRRSVNDSYDVADLDALTAAINDFFYKKITS